MVTEKESAPAAGPAQHAAFFRQSGWLMIANIGGGILMWGVHLLGRKVGTVEYGLFGTLLAVVMLVPGGPLQMVFAQQTARALATNRERELSGIIRMIWLGLFGLWLLATVGVLAFQGRIVKLWEVGHPSALWVTLPAVLLSLWAPIFQGTLQGKQDFFWLGWSMLANGFARLLMAGAVVWAFHIGAVGMMLGVVFGLGLTMAIAVWQSRSLWLLPPLPFNWPSLLRQVVPLLIGFVLVQFLFTGDTMFVKHFFPNAAGAYVCAGTLSRALYWLVSPLASVMFPRIVHSAARSEKTNLIGVVLVGTAILSVVGAAGLTVLGPWFIDLVYGPAFALAATVLPWYALAMVPLGLANVLVNNLLARSNFRVVPFLLLLAVAYAAALVAVGHRSQSLVTVLQTMGICNLVLFGICAWLTWGVKDQTTMSDAGGAAPAR